MSDSASFLAGLNHELRNPLNAVVGMTDLALLTSLTVEQTQYLSIIKSAAESLERILNEASQYGELARLAGDPFPGEVASFSIHQLVEEVDVRWQRVATAAGVSLAIRIAAGVPHRLISHPQRVAQLLDCLIGHGLEHTQQGQIDLEVSTIAADSQSPSLHLALRDTGHAVDPEKLARLFVPFSKIRRAADRKHVAVLSLPIAALLVRGLRGEIHAHSLAAGGLAVECTVPTCDREREAVACANS